MQILTSHCEGLTAGFFLTRQGVALSKKSEGFWETRQAQSSQNHKSILPPSPPSIPTDCSVIGTRWRHLTQGVVQAVDCFAGLGGKPKVLGLISQRHAGSDLLKCYGFSCLDLLLKESSNSPFFLWQGRGPSTNARKPSCLFLLDMLEV